jgi:hypothetical protein
MGTGYHIRCKNCREEMNTKLVDYDNYSSYEILTGCGFFSFTKEQLLKGYNKWLKNNPDIIKIIKNKLKEGYKFHDPIGWLPCYCENCQILDSNFYFEMKKNRMKYIPEYKCKLCYGLLKSIIIYDGGLGRITMDYMESDSSDLISIYSKETIFDGEYYNSVYSLFEIMDKEKKVYKLKCRKCNKFDYEIIESLNWD